MRFLRPTLAVVLVATAAAIASAQVQTNIPANPRALPALQQDLITAIESMKSALPIYDGNRMRSIRAAHRALLIVDIAIAGKRAPKRKAPAVVGGPSKGAKAKYTPEQIQGSQTNMRQGLTALQTAWKDLQTAAGSNPNKQGMNTGKSLQTAINEATTAISLHSAQG